jgi:oligoendopeptidase F
MSISCPSLPLSLFDDLIKIDSKFEEGFKKFQNDLSSMSGKLKDNSKELEIIHKLFVSLNDRVNQSNKKEYIIDHTYKDNLIDSKIEMLNKKIDTFESNIKTEIENSKKEIKNYIEEKTEEIHSRLLKNLGFIFEQQIRAFKSELNRPNPPVIIPVVNKQEIVEEPWTKVDKKNYKPK